MSNIPAGYSLIITSWENDGDNYNNKIIHSLTEEDVQFYIYFLRHFHFYWNENRIGKGWGNEDDSDYPDAESIAITSAFEKYPPSSEKLLVDVKSSIEYWKENPEESCDWIYETIGKWGNGSTYRVFDSFEVYHYPKEVEDVTEQFQV